MSVAVPPVSATWRPPLWTRAAQSRGMGDPAIEVEGLTKRFGTVTAVDQASFEVPVGSLYGFLGPNGSGKTTTLGMLTGLVPPEGGRARILGFDVAAEWDAAIAHVGALVEEPAFYPYLTGRQNLRLVARLLRVEDARVDAALGRAGLAEASGRKYRGYSQGMRRRLGIAAALLGDAPVLLLDEPTNGLDPAGQREVRGLMQELVREGRTVFVSSHMLHEVQEVCTHAAVIHKGRILAHGRLDAILGGEEAVVVEVDDPVRARDALHDLAVTMDGPRLRVRAPAAMAPEINRRLVTAGIAVRELWRSRAGLEERFLAMTAEAPA